MYIHCKYTVYLKVYALNREWTTTILNKNLFMPHEKLIPCYNTIITQYYYDKESRAIPLCHRGARKYLWMLSIIGIQ